MEPFTRLGLAALTEFAFQGGDVKPLKEDILRSSQGAPDVGACMDLSVIEQLLGNAEGGQVWQDQALAACQTFRTYREGPARKTVLIYAAPTAMGENTPVDFLLANGEFEVLTHYLTDSTAPLPPHDVAFCAVPTDRAETGIWLQRLATLSGQHGAAVLNFPDDPVKLQRDVLADRLFDIPGLRHPTVVTVTPTEALHLDAVFPCVIRPVGSHAGHGLAKVETMTDLQTYFSERSETVFYLSDFIDYASEDKKYRKYRLVLIDGVAYPVHMAISQNWDVWYMNADMLGSEENRFEEERFMDDFDSFRARHGNALATLSEKIPLDYFGIDCAEDRDGNLVVFEADNALIVHDMDCPTTFPYKKRHMPKLFAAFEAMLLARCSSMPRLRNPKPQDLHA